MAVRDFKLKEVSAGSGAIKFEERQQRVSVLTFPCLTYMRDEKKPGERTCPLDCCPTFVRSLKVHIRNCQLPWYVFEAGTNREMLVI